MNPDIPQAGTTKQYIPDTYGGWFYTITTTITVEQQRLDKAQAHVDDIKARIIADQALVDELEPVLATIPLIKDTPVDIAPSIASSTPNTLM